MRGRFGQRSQSRAGVKQLCLFHHDPDHDDKQIDACVRHARQLVAKQRAKLKVDAARELQTIELPVKPVSRRS